MGESLHKKRNVFKNLISFFLFIAVKKIFLLEFYYQNNKIIRLDICVADTLLFFPRNVNLPKRYV